MASARRRRGRRRVSLAAERLAVDVVCLCSHGRAGLSKALLGSVAGAVMARTRRPLLDVRPPRVEEVCMKFCVLALDYDGTIVGHGRPGPAVMAALQEARAQGIVLRHALVFACNGKPIGSPARTLRDFVTTLSRLPSIRSITMPRRGDFSPWIGEVFGDHPQANAAWVAHAEG